MIWTDTFANNRQSDIFSTTLGENNVRLAALNRQDIRVIVGNPPYSVGQESANDDNQNDHYEELDARLAATYVQATSSSNKNKLYDSYIGTVAKLAMRQPFVLFKGLTFQKLCLPGAFRPGDHHNKMLRPGLCVVHASPQYL